MLGDGRKQRVAFVLEKKCWNVIDHVILEYLANESRMSTGDHHTFGRMDKEALGCVKRNLEDK